MIEAAATDLIPAGNKAKIQLRKNLMQLMEIIAVDPTRTSMGASSTAFVRTISNSIAITAATRNSADISAKFVLSLRMDVLSSSRTVDFMPHVDANVTKYGGPSAIAYGFGLSLAALATGGAR
jgi:hypothetical protein